MARLHMDRLVIDANFIEAERGAVLAEMHMYENDPSSMLNDALIYTSFLAHPYRNNTIAWYLSNPESGSVSSIESVAPDYELPARYPTDETPASAPVQRLLRGGVPVLFMSSDIASSPLSADPETRMRQEFELLMAPLPSVAGQKVSPVVIAVARHTSRSKNRCAGSERRAVSTR